MSRTSDATAVRTSGIVLCLIGGLTFGVVAFWNGMGDYPTRASLEHVSGAVVDGRLEEISTQTAIEKWIVIDVALDGAGTNERWVFPGQTPEWTELVSALEAGARVSGLAMSQLEKLRWSDVPVRVIWSLSREERSREERSREERGADVELVSYDEVIAVEEAARHQSPVVGWTMIALGVVLLLGSRMRLGAGRDLTTAG